MTDNTVLLCMGTRPEIIKMAPVYHALKKTELTPLVLHTGQHDTLAEALYPFFEMEPDFKFDLSRERNSLGHLFAIKMERMDQLFAELDTSAVLVQGDTSSALSGALTAFYHKIPVGHIEAGLRSHHDYEPYPEEKNRELIARLSLWHFAPTRRALMNLEKEGIAKDNCFLVGNTIVDSVNWALQHVDKPSFDPAPEALNAIRWLESNAENTRLVVVTAHRRESWDGQIAEIARGIRSIAEKYPDIRIIWPVHPNPIVKNAVHEAMHGLDVGAKKQVWLCDPLNYPDMLYFMKHSWLVLTDSGGLQEEAVTLKIPVLVLRDKTERPEVVDAHGGALIGTSSRSILDWVGKLHTDCNQYNALISPSNPFGDGNTGKNIAEILQDKLIDHTHSVDINVGVN
ncbi:MAG: UDP-N-acetylglucosamine 2-epimerase (non-hydrolyzing) [Proteobacteria bacterium]|nr:UDP-N-acetylglucosamine 2-epimerase (non-hydrolyzing) [Pseudomonadota bacterium]